MLFETMELTKSKAHGISVKFAGPGTEYTVTVPPIPAALVIVGGQAFCFAMELAFLQPQMRPRSHSVNDDP